MGEVSWISILGQASDKSDDEEHISKVQVSGSERGMGRSVVHEGSTGKSRITPKRRSVLPLMSPVVPVVGV